MSTVADIISKVRVELFDEQNARFSDDNLVILVQKSVDRMNKVLMKANIKFAKSSYDFDTVADQDQYAVPSDYMALDSLYRVRKDDKTGWATSVTLRNDDEWERMISATETTNWRVWGGNIELFDMPKSVVSLRFYYWPMIDFTGWATTSTMPWGGQMDEVIAEYVSLRCKNIDEKDLSWDLRLLAELADDWLDIYGTSDPAASTTQGFYPVETAWDNN